MHICNEDILDLIQQGKTNELVKLGSRVVKPMISLLSHSSMKVRNGCIEALAEIAKTDETTFQRLIEELNTPRLNVEQYIHVKRGCIYALGLVGDKRAAKSLIISLLHGSDDIRKACAEALGSIGNQKAVSALLIHASSNRYFDIRQACVMALIHIGKKDRHSSYELINELNTNSSLSIKSICARVLGMIGERRAVDALIEGLKNSDENVRISCEKSLILIAKSNEKTFQRLIKELKTNRNRKIKETCADALGIIGDKRAVDVLIESLDDFYRFSREAEVTVINALGLIGDPKAVTPLIRILKRDIKKTSPNSQKKANKALVNIAKLDKVTFYLLISGLLPIGKNNTEDCIGILTENTDEKGSCFIKIICERSEECALEIGMEKTLATIKEYIGFIKDYYTKEELKEIQIRLYSFYRKTFEEESSSRIKMDLPKLEIKPPKRGPEICAKLLRVGS